MNQFRLDGKTIIVTGASSGIGRQIAIDCSLAGADVILLGRDASRLQETQSQLRAGDHALVCADLVHGESAESLLTETIGSRKVHGFIHAAGISSTLPLRSVSDKKLRQFFEINVIAGISLAKLLARPSYIDQNGSSFIFIASVMAVVGESAKTLYSATKGALLSASRSMAIELAAKRIRVNCISPGVVVTPMTDQAFYSQDEESRKRVEALHPLGVGQPSDVSNAAVFLLADAARWITGTNLIVDGGYTAK